MPLVRQPKRGLACRKSTTDDDDDLTRRRPSVESRIENMMDSRIGPRRPIRPLGLFARADGEQDVSCVDSAPAREPDFDHVAVDRARGHSVSVKPRFRSPSQWALKSARAGVGSAPRTLAFRFRRLRLPASSWAMVEVEVVGQPQVHVIPVVAVQACQREADRSGRSDPIPASPISRAARCRRVRDDQPVEVHMDLRAKGGSPSSGHTQAVPQGEIAEGDSELELGSSREAYQSTDCGGERGLHRAGALGARTERLDFFRAAVLVLDLQLGPADAYFATFFSRCWFFVDSLKAVFDG